MKRLTYKAISFVTLLVILTSCEQQTNEPESPEEFKDDTQAPSHHNTQQQQQQQQRQQQHQQHQQLQQQLQQQQQKDTQQDHPHTVNTQKVTVNVQHEEKPITVDTQTLPGSAGTVEPPPPSAPQAEPATYEPVAGEEAVTVDPPAQEGDPSTVEPPVNSAKEIPEMPDIYEAAMLDRDLIEQISLNDEEEGTKLLTRTYEVIYKRIDGKSNQKVEVWLQTYNKQNGESKIILFSQVWKRKQVPGGDTLDNAVRQMSESARKVNPTPPRVEIEQEVEGPEFGGDLITEDMPEIELTPEQQEAEDLYQNGLKLQSLDTYTANKKAYQSYVAAADMGHKTSREMVAFSNLFGDYLTQNLTRALEMFEELSVEGNTKGQLGLGIMYAAGIHVNSSQAKALVFITFAALGGDEQAQMILGYRHLSGVGVASSCETALIYYEKAASTVATRISENSGSSVVQRIRLIDEVEGSPSLSSTTLDEDLIQYYQFLADKGDTSAQIGLGQLYYQGGRGIEVDHELAFYYFSKASSGGNPTADAYLGKIYAEGSGSIEQNYAAAFDYFSKAAEEGNPIGQSGLGMMYLKGHFVERDLTKAVKYFQSSADQNWVDGQLQLGLLYFKGEGVRKDHKSAIKYFNLASQGGNVLAFYNLAKMHASGWGVMRACHTAVELYKNVAERGVWAKMLMEAYDFYTRGYVDVAMLKYLVLAELGYEVAQSNVAYILDSGETSAYKNIEQFKRALLQWSRAAGQGNTVARLKLGDYHYYGMGTEVDYETAIQHYRVAGEQNNNAQAMYNLGYMHEAGLGLKQDLHLAKRFYDMAGDAHKDAQVPVSLALARLSIISSLDTFTDTSVLWDRISELHPAVYFGPSWDMYLITFLGMMFGLIMMIRTQILRPN